MTKTLTALATAAALSVAVVAIPQESQAAWRGHHWGGGAFIGGLAAGAIVGGALAAPYYYGGYGYGDGPYYGGYGYYGGGPYAYGNCWRERVATPYGWRWQRVCE